MIASCPPVASQRHTAQTIAIYAVGLKFGAAAYHRRRALAKRGLAPSSLALVERMRRAVERRWPRERWQFSERERYLLLRGALHGYRRAAQMRRSEV